MNHAVCVPWRMTIAKRPSLYARVDRRAFQSSRPRRMLAYVYTVRNPPQVAVHVGSHRAPGCPQAARHRLLADLSLCAAHICSQTSADMYKQRGPLGRVGYCSRVCLCLHARPPTPHAACRLHVSMYMSHVTRKCRACAKNKVVAWTHRFARARATAAAAVSRRGGR